MASNAIWARYHALKDAIASAVDEAINDEDIREDEIDNILVLISPDLDEVYAYVNTSIREIDMKAFPDWHIEHADSVEEADGIADLYFDLR